MLIVVVIIGILAAALIPRLQTVQARARDTKRKADVTQIGSALAVYGSDNGNFSGLQNAWNTSAITGQLREYLVVNASYMTEMPNDLNSSLWSLGYVGSGASGSAAITTMSGTAAGTYGFTTLTRTAISNAALVVVARTETDGSLSNWVNAATGTYSGVASQGSISKGWSVDDYERNCISVALSTGTQVVPGGSCRANRSSPDLRYIYTY